MANTATQASYSTFDTVTPQRVSCNFIKTECSNCNLQELCFPFELSQDEVGRFDELIAMRKRVRRNVSLYSSDDSFAYIFAIRSGFFRTDVMLEDGRHHVTGFHMAGEVIGLDGIGIGKYSCNATALEDSEVCVISYESLETLSREIQSLQQHFHRVMSHEIVRDHNVMLLLGAMRAEERLAAFLLNLSQRFATRGYSAVDFHLRMKREEIGSYLGLTPETVSRCFSRFQEEGLLIVKHKHVHLLDMPRLKKIIGQYVS